MRCTTYTHRIHSLSSPLWSLVTNWKAACAESLIRGCLTIQTQTGSNYVLDPRLRGIFIRIQTRGCELSFYRLKVIISLLRLSPTQIEASICGCCTTPTFFNFRNIKYSVTNISEADMRCDNTRLAYINFHVAESTADFQRAWNTHTSSM